MMWFLLSIVLWLLGTVYTVYTFGQVFCLAMEAIFRSNLDWVDRTVAFLVLIIGFIATGAGGFVLLNLLVLIIHTL